MELQLPEVEVGETIRHGRAEVAPLFGTTPVPGRPYLLASEALSQGCILVEEVTEEGRVSSLKVTNSAGIAALFIEGEVLKGAKQDRVLNTTLLIGAGSTTEIPVSCVERGRWELSTDCMIATGSLAPATLRAVLRASVSDSKFRGGRHDSDQSGVWRQVDDLSVTCNSASATSSLTDWLCEMEGYLRSNQDYVSYVDGAIGMMLSVSGRPMMFDVFERPDVCKSVWKRLITSYVLSSIPFAEQAKEEKSLQLASLLDLSRSAPWRRCDTVGDGHEFRASSSTGAQSIALSLGNAVVHWSSVS